MRRRSAVLLLCLTAGMMTGYTEAVEITATEIIGERNFLTGYPPTNPDGTVNVVIECPAGSTTRWEVEPDGVLRVELWDGVPFKLRYLAYPANYGMIPGTLFAATHGGDGEPLDVFVLGEAIERGTLVRVKVIGALALLDAGEQDDKLIAVVKGTPLGNVEDIEELDRLFPNISTIIETWVMSFKGDAGEYESFSFVGPRSAMRVIDSAASDFEEAVSSPR